MESIQFDTGANKIPIGGMEPMEPIHDRDAVVVLDQGSGANNFCSEWSGQLLMVKTLQTP
jgi:hypothetical protein